jgi:hypothetical protein
MDAQAIELYVRTFNTEMAGRSKRSVRPGSNTSSSTSSRSALRVPAYARNCLEHFGIAAEKIVLVGQERLSFSELVVPERLFRLNHSADVRSRWTYQTIAAAAPAYRSAHDRVYLSRRRFNWRQFERVVANEVEIEDIFRAPRLRDCLSGDLYLSGTGFALCSCLRHGGHLRLRAAQQRLHEARHTSDRAWRPALRRSSGSNASALQSHRGCEKRLHTLCWRKVWP